MSVCVCLGVTLDRRTRTSPDDPHDTYECQYCTSTLPTSSDGFARWSAGLDPHIEDLLDTKSSAGYLYLAKSNESKTRDGLNDEQGGRSRAIGSGPPPGAWRRKTPKMIPAIMNT